MLLRTLPLLCSLALLAGCPGGDDTDKVDTGDTAADGYSGTDCLDADCDPDAVCDVSVADYELGSITGTALATGSTLGMGDNWDPTCTSSTAEDVTYAWIAPYAGSFTFDLSGTSYDTVIGLYAADGTSLGCDDDSGTGTTSLKSITVTAGQLVIVNIDGYSSYTGDYTLAIY